MTSEKEKAAEKYANEHWESEWEWMNAKIAFLAGWDERDKHPQQFGVWKTKKGYQVKKKGGKLR